MRTCGADESTSSRQPTFGPHTSHPERNSSFNSSSSLITAALRPCGQCVVALLVEVASVALLPPAAAAAAAALRPVEQEQDGEVLGKIQCCVVLRAGAVCRTGRWTCLRRRRPLPAPLPLKEPRTRRRALSLHHQLLDGGLDHAQNSLAVAEVLWRVWRRGAPGAGGLWRTWPTSKHAARAAGAAAVLIATSSLLLYPRNQRGLVGADHGGGGSAALRLALGAL